MAGPERRAELKAEFRETRPDAGVYRIVNTATGRTLIGSALNLASARNRFAFAQSTGSTSGLDLRLAPDLREFGFEAFAFEVLETLAVTADKSAATTRDELALMESLWREKLAGTAFY